MSPSPAKTRLGSAVLAAGEMAVDLVWPRQCWVCSASLPKPETGSRSTAHDAYFCPACTDAFASIEPPYCNRCGEPYDLETEGPFQCWNCSGRRMGFEFAVSGYRAEGSVRDMIHRFKYGREVALRCPLTTLLEDALKDERLASEDLSRWVLVPVPLHRTREFEREFNQSWELCQELAKRTGTKASDALIRTQPTQSQASLNRRHRLRNLRGVFARKKPWLWQKPIDLTGARVLLVDDVLTTGATTHECARILRREAGVEKVVVITVARG